MGPWISKAESERRERLVVLLEMTRGRTGLDGVERSIARGDVHETNIRFAKRWLKQRRQQERREWLNSPDGAATRQADAADTANRRAMVAIWISIAALVVASWEHVKVWLG